MTSLTSLQKRSSEIPAGNVSAGRENSTINGILMFSRSNLRFHRQPNFGCFFTADPPIMARKHKTARLSGLDSRI